MKTDDLIRMLATDAGPAPRAVVARRLGPAAVAGLAIGVVLVVLVTPLVPMALMRDLNWWLKLGYALALAGAAGWWAAQLARPGMPDRRGRWLAMAVVAAMVVLGVVEQLLMPSGQRLAAWLGHSSNTCSRNVLLLSLPALALALWAMRGLAPTNPRRAGLAAGVLAGSVGASAYALCCTEVSPSFVATWYTLGIAGSGALGALLGPRVLRW
jgi:hypothetical protein